MTTVARTVASARAFGLDAGEVRRLVGAVLPRDDAAGDWAARFARAAWTTLAEPGDATAGSLVESIGPAAALELVIDRSGGDSGSAPPDADRGQLEAGLARWTPRLSARSVVRSLEQAARFGIACSIPEDPWWPTGLADLGPCSALALWSRGDVGRIPVAPASAAAIVGARAATGYGERVAVELAAGLADRGVAVVSGGAYGIDGAAHRATLASGAVTVAVLAGGLDRVYPSGHEALLGRVAAEGVLVAEVPCGVPPTRFRFLNRNRAIAAIAGATVVVEAGSRSGSLNTAGHAAALGRPLGAVPGPVTSPASAGCHRLLREYDATCVTGVGDVLELLGHDSAADAGAAPRDDVAIRLLDALSERTARSAADVAARAGLPIAEAMSRLGLMELDGAVARAGQGGWVRRASRQREQAPRYTLGA